MEIHLQELEMMVNLGVPDEERATPQKVLVDVWYSLDPSAADETDELVDTVDYDDIYACLKTLPEKREWKLIEVLTMDVYGAVKAVVPKMGNLRVGVTKFPFEKGKVTVYYDGEVEDVD